MPAAHGDAHELLLVVATVLVASSGIAAVVVDLLLRRGMLGTGGRRLGPDELLIAPMVALSLGAAAIHFGVTGAHFAEWWAYGVFFIATGWFQAFWSVVFAVRPRVWLARMSAIANAAIVLTWLVTRTSGLPFGPDAGTAERVGLADTVATAFEIGLVLGGLWFGSRRVDVGRRIRVGVASAAVFLSVFAVGVALTTSVALASVATEQPGAHGDVTNGAHDTSETEPTP